MIRRIAVCLLCLVLLASLCTAWASEEPTEPDDRSWQAIIAHFRIHSDSDSNNEDANITVEMEGWPGFFSGLILGAGIGATIASGIVLGCSYWIYRKRKNK